MAAGAPTSTGPPLSPGRCRAAIVLAGGGARRWGGRDKTAVELDGLPVLAHVVHGLPTGIPVVVVGPPGHPFAATARRALLHWTLEEPAGGGPVAGLVAGLSALPGDVDEVVLLAGDLPDAGTAVPRLLAALTSTGTSTSTSTSTGTSTGTSADADADADADAAIGVDPHGRRQPLLAAFRVTPLRAALDLSTDDPPDTPSDDPVVRDIGHRARSVRRERDGGVVAGDRYAGRSMHEVLSRLRTRPVPVTAVEAFDLDTPAALESLLARRARGEREHPAGR